MVMMVEHQIITSLMVDMGTENKYPIKRKATITIEYWECLNKKHRHTTKEVATKCIQKQIDKESKPKHITNEWTKEKFLELYRLYNVENLTFKAIGKIFNNVTGQQISCMYRAGRSRGYYKYPWEEKGE